MAFTERLVQLDGHRLPTFDTTLSANMKLSATFAVLAAALPYVLGQSQEWGQCGGIGWTGATTCVAGTVCTVINSYYSQCLPGSVSRLLTLPLGVRLTLQSELTIRLP